jgi:hypothetical protein
MRFQVSGRSLEHLRKAGRCLDKGHLLWKGKESTLDLAERGPVITPLLRQAQDAADPGMGILNVIDWVFIGLFLGHLEIEIEMAVGASHEKIVTGRIPSHLVHNLLEGDKLSRSGGHGHRNTSPQEVHKLNQNDLKGLLFKAKGLNSCLHTRDIAVVVGTPDIDDPMEAPLELVAVIGDVGGK